MVIVRAFVGLEQYMDVHALRLYRAVIIGQPEVDEVYPAIVQYHVGGGEVAVYNIGSVELTHDDPDVATQVGCDDVFYFRAFDVLHGDFEVLDVVDYGR